MKYISSLFIFSFLVFSATAGDQNPKRRASYGIVESHPDKLLKKTEAAFTFCFKERNSGKPVNASIRYSYNGKEITAPANTTGKHQLKVKPGKYRFQFFYTTLHEEIYTDSIEIKPTYSTTIDVYFERSDEVMEADKPVIYLYPQQATAVSVQLAIKGNFLFTYPAYNTGWNVTAYPDGTLQQGDQTFKYLFWEGETSLPANTNLSEGFVMETAALTSFFEEKLAHLGLNSVEMQDFITYWVPRMQSHSKHYVHFVLNEDYNTSAAITVSPKPDQMIRVFMLWSPLEKDQEMAVKAQELPSLKRTGFTLVEWGGTQINIQQDLTQQP